jgi:hypothetical protein
VDHFRLPLERDEHLSVVNAMMKLGLCVRGKVLEYLLGWGSSQESEACLIDRENFLNIRHFNC